MTEVWAGVSKRIESYEQEIVRFQSELTAVPALGPEYDGIGEAEKVKVVEKWAESLKPDETIRIDAPDDRVPSGSRPNLIAIFKGEGKGRVWVLSHMDIVPPGESTLWNTDPYTLHQVGDRIIGRGVEDNQHGMVASYFALKALVDEDVTPKYDVGLIFVADEETGSKLGLRYILEQRPDLFSPADLIFVPDSGSKAGDLIEVAEKSMLWMKFTVKGLQCHASRPEKGANTLRASAKIITAVDEALHRRFNATDALFDPPESTFEPTKKENNVPNVNTIPGEDVFYFDSRVLPEYSLKDVKAEALKAALGAVENDGIRVEMEAPMEEQAPEPTPADAPAAEAIKRGIAEIHGLRAKPIGIGGGTVAAFFRKKGLPAVVWATIEENAHAPNEFTRISMIIDDAKIMARVYMGL